MDCLKQRGAITSIAVMLLLTTITAAAVNFSNPRGCRSVGYRFVNDHLFLSPLTPLAQPKPAIDDSPSANKDENHKPAPPPKKKWTTKDANVFMLANMSHRPLYLESVIDHDNPISVKSVTVIKPYRWSSFSLDQDRIEFTCKSVRGQHSKAISCAKALHICQYSRTKYGGHNKGTYWIVENVYGRKAIVHHTIRAGILLR